MGDTASVQGGIRQWRYLRGEGGGKQAEEPVCGNDGHLTLLCLQMLVQLGKLFERQLLQ